MIQIGDHHRRLLWALSEAGQSSRTELALAAGISKAAVTAASRDLINFGLISEADQVRGTGRPSTLLALRRGTVWFAGLSLRPGRARMVLCDITGRIAGQRDLPGRVDPVEICGGLESDLAALLKECGIAHSALCGLGVSVSGVVNAEQDTCIRSTLMGWDDVPLGLMATEALGLPVMIENDANALAIQEKLVGKMGGDGSFALVNVADGIGGALLLGRQLFRGASGGAGEIAHITVAPGGKPCICGKRGCLDTVASLRAIAAAGRDMGFADVSLDALERAAAQGETCAVGILHGAGEALGLALAHLIQIVNPERVVVRMEAETTKGLFAMALAQSLDANVLPQMRERTQLDIGTTPEGGHAAGAALVAAHRLLLMPHVNERNAA